MDRFSQQLPSLAAHKAHVYGDEEKPYCAVCDSYHYAPLCEPEAEDETGCTSDEIQYVDVPRMQPALWPEMEGKPAKKEVA